MKGSLVIKSFKKKNFQILEKALRRKTTKRQNFPKYQHLSLPFPSSKPSGTEQREYL